MKKVSDYIVKYNNVLGINLDILLAAIGIIGSLGVTYVSNWSRRIDDHRFLAKYSGADIEAGTFSGNSSSENWQLDRVIRNSSGETVWRSYVIPVKFRHSFSEPPQILTNLTWIDATNKANVRFLIAIQHIEKDGCDIVLRSWGDSEIYVAEGSWIAIQSSPK